MSVGADFPDSVKREARRLAAFKCCLCRDEIGDHVHHIVPKEEGGQGVIENAMLLCVRCHDRFGHRKDRRSQLEDARDTWYEIVRAKYSASDVDRFEEVAKKTVDQISAEIKNLGELVLASIKNGTMTRQDAANVASTMVSSIVAPPSQRYLHPAYMPSVVDPIVPPPLTIRNLMSGGDDPEKPKP